MLFNPYMDNPEWPASVVVQHCDENDVPGDCRLGQRISPDDRPFKDFDERDEFDVLHELYVRGTLRAISKR